jgi:hypothetical protein
MATGRPSKYSNKIALDICEQITKGKSLNRICKSDLMPSISTAFKWLDKHSEFRDNYTQARKEQAETIFEEMIDIADESTNDFMTDENGHKKVDQEAMARTRLRIETRKWVLGKMRPKKYSDKLQVDHSGKVTHRNIEIVGKEDIDPDDIGFTDS